jgi:hypothetical protein
MIDASCYLTPATIEHDPATRRHLLVYRPAGVLLDTHEPRRWYARRLNDYGAEPRSRPFATQGEALVAIRDGSWDLIVSPTDRRPIRTSTR